MKNPLPSVSSANNKPLNFSVDPRWVILALLAVITMMFLIWKPWQQSVSADNRTVSVTGEATVRAEPDEYAFYPAYQIKNADKQAAIDAAAARSKELVAGLKKMGVQDRQIKTNTSGYQDPIYGPTDTSLRVAPPAPSGDGEYTYTLQLTVTVADRAAAQKVQDYLVTTSPTGSVSPQPTFSEDKRKNLENQARDEATTSARAKADQSAKNLGFKVASVKSVEDGAGFGGIQPYEGRAMDAVESKAAIGPLSVQPGENELSYSVTVVYYIK